MATVLNRADIIDGLRDLIAELRTAGEVAGIRLVGGAALALRYQVRSEKEVCPWRDSNPQPFA